MLMRKQFWSSTTSTDVMRTGAWLKPGTEVNRKDNKVARTIRPTPKRLSEIIMMFMGKRVTLIFYGAVRTKLTIKSGVSGSSLKICSSPK